MPICQDDLYMLGISSGHHYLYSTEFLNFFIVGIDQLSKNIFFKMKEIFYGIYSFKRAIGYVLQTVEKEKLDLVLVFSEFDQFSTISNIVQTNGDFKQSGNDLDYSIYSVLKPQSGFLTSLKRFTTPDFIIGSLPKDVYYSKSIFMAFGYNALLTTLKELNGRVGSLSFGVVDSNQKHVWSNTDFVVPGNDDSTRVPFFLTSVTLNSILQVSQNFFYFKHHQQEPLSYTLKPLTTRVIETLKISKNLLTKKYNKRVLFSKFMEVIKKTKIFKIKKLKKLKKLSIKFGYLTFKSKPKIQINKKHQLYKYKLKVNKLKLNKYENLISKCENLISKFETTRVNKFKIDKYNIKIDNYNIKMDNYNIKTSNYYEKILKRRPTILNKAFSIKINPNNIKKYILNSIQKWNIIKKKSSNIKKKSSNIKKLKIAIKDLLYNAYTHHLKTDKNRLIEIFFSTGSGSFLRKGFTKRWFTFSGRSRRRKLRSRPVTRKKFLFFYKNTYVKLAKIEKKY